MLKSPKKYGELQQLVPDNKDEGMSVYPSYKNMVKVEFIFTGTVPDGTKLHCTSVPSLT